MAYIGRLDRVRHLDAVAAKLKREVPERRERRKNEACEAKSPERTFGVREDSETEAQQSYSKRSSSGRFTGCANPA